MGAGHTFGRYELYVDPYIIRSNMRNGLAGTYGLVIDPVQGRLTTQLADGRIVVLSEGYFENIYRFDANGILDQSFGCNYGLGGSASHWDGGPPPAVEIGPDDRIWLGNIANDQYGSAHMIKVRLPDGTPDQFASHQSNAEHFYGMKVRSDGTMIFSSSSYQWVKLGTNGAESGVGTSGGGDIGGEQNSIDIYADGRVIRAGLKSGWPAENYSKLDRWTAAAITDPTFVPASTIPGETIQVVKLGPGGVIYIAGMFNQVNSTTRHGVARLLANGTIDPLFDPLSGFDGTARDIAVQPDGKLVVTGAFQKYRGITVNGICRLNADASLDAGFAVGTGLDEGGVGHRVLLRPDGRILVGGLFTHYAGVNRGSLVSIHNDGSVDTDFDTGVGFRDNFGSPGLVSDFALQSSGQVVVVGEFTEYEGIGRNRIARLGDGLRIRINPRAWLEDGCIISPLMCDELRLNGLIPLITPYRQPDYQQLRGGGNEMISPSLLGGQGPDAIVDWVWVGLGTTEYAADLVATRSALLQGDGDIVDLDGSSPLTFFIPPGDYHVSIRHRNHLGVVTANAYTLSLQSPVIDLTSPNYPTYGNEAQKFEDGRYMLWGGDANGDGELKYTGQDNDRDLMLFAIGGGGSDQHRIRHLPPGGREHGW